MLVMGSEGLCSKASLSGSKKASRGQRGTIYLKTGFSENIEHVKKNAKIGVLLHAFYLTILSKQGSTIYIF